MDGNAAQDLTAEQLATYDYVVVAFSGGKDSTACVLHLLDLGVPRAKIELWHHDVDGREGSTLMDWPCTRDYCRRFAAALGLRLYFSWKRGGFEREMLRDLTATAPIVYETPHGERVTGGSGPPGKRLKFPQVSPDLSVRWCSAYLKIDVGTAAIRGQSRFLYRRTLFVTGERAQESASRARYKPFEPHRSDLRRGRQPRHVDQWRPVHGWTEQQVWALIERHRINPHPAYRLGWGRVSCMKCIFGSADQWASVRVIDPAGLSEIATYESRFGTTIKRKLNVIQTADKGTAYEMSAEDKLAALARVSDEPIVLDEGAWRQPKGAYGDSCGPV